jgi:phenylpropionate dioxygenase-like ring-hydroxylating dioxygenase large terminal subunit
LNPAEQDRPETGSERQRRVALEIQRRMVEHIRTGGTDLEAGPMRNRAASYTSPQWYELEQERVFTRLPLLAGMSKDLPEAGSKLLFEAAGPSILIVRKEDGTLQAYLNMCTHRASRLVTECTTAKRMTCGFHGWTFNLGGELIGHPGGKRGFDGIDKSRFRLIEVPVEEWHGLIFVIARPGARADIDVAAYLGEFAPELAQMGFERANPIKQTRLDVAANWKYAYDTYGEGYHFATLHPTSIARTAHNDMMVHDRFGLHARINFPYRDQDACVGKPEEEWVRRPYGGVHLLFPNTVINVSSMGPGQVFSIYRVFPDGGPDRAFSLMAAYRSGEVPDDVDMKPWENFHDFIMGVVANEDYSISAAGQRNLRYAPPDFEVTYGANEGVLQHFHRNLAALLGRDI